MTKLIMMAGLPRSGKSTKSKELGYPIVNPDSIRLSIHGQAYLPLAEKLVWPIAHIMVQSLFKAGHDTVILDATNVSFKRREEWMEEADEIETIIIGTSPDECKRRAIADGRLDLIPVIDKMALEWDMSKPWEVYVGDKE